MAKKVFSGKKGLRNRLVRLAFFGLNLILGASLLVGCTPKATEAPTGLNAIVAPVETAPAQPEPVAPTATPAPPAAPAAQPAPAAQYPMEIKDQLGRTVKIKKVPQRIISIAPSDTEIIFALGLGYKVVGVDQFSDFPADAKTKTNLGSYTSPSIEKIIALNPDLILTTAVHQAKVIPILESMGYTVLALDPKTIEEVLDAITLVGKVTDTQKEAIELVASLDKRVKAVTEQTKSLADAKKPKVFYIVWYNPLMGPGKGTFQDDLINKTGGINIASNLNGFATISLEAVIAANPEIMIAGISIGTDMTDQNVALIKNEPRLKDTPARQNNKIYILDGNIVSRPGPRIVDALEQFAKFIHPEIFK